MALGGGFRKGASFASEMKLEFDSNVLLAHCAICWPARPASLFFFFLNWSLPKAFLIAQLVKNPPSTQETPVRFLGWKDPLEKGKATHSSVLAWRIPWTVYCRVHGVTKSWTWLSDFHSLSHSWLTMLCPSFLVYSKVIHYINTCRLFSIIGYCIYWV